MNCSKISAKRKINNCKASDDLVILTPKVILAMTPKERQKLWVRNVQYCVICGKEDPKNSNACSQYSNL